MDDPAYFLNNLAATVEPDDVAGPQIKREAKGLPKGRLVGGFLARKGDGLPGWQTISRGWQRLMWVMPRAKAG